jgi:hypothetical protein
MFVRGIVRNEFIPLTIIPLTAIAGRRASVKPFIEN